jgi:NAD(P)H-hydrate repair Nnr-like enzyme with NAD(P)H-hydrate epimerase domain
MARIKERQVGVLVGEGASGGEAIVTVRKVGRDYRIRWAGKDHLCHPSVRDMDDVKREALLVFSVRNAVFVSA